MLLLLGLLPVAAPAVNPGKFPDNATVVSSCGPIRGHLHRDGILAFKGIPYAKPPKEELRWRPPEPATCWNGTLEAANFSSPCAQSGGESGSEDCLYLNVYRTTPGSPEGLLPVLFYIHGGSLIVGDGRLDFSNFMLHGCENGCITVVIQYRLDMFGWLANEPLSAEQGGVSGNYGLLDQQMALSWVQREIAAFGGDKRRVTVAGQSSGGTSIIALLASPASRGLFSRAISLSGSPNVTMDLPAAEQQNAQITVAGCPSAHDAPTTWLACMRNASTALVLGARPGCWATPKMDVLPTSTAGWRKRSGQLLDLAKGQCEY